MFHPRQCKRHMQFSHMSVGILSCQAWQQYEKRARVLKQLVAGLRPQTEIASDALQLVRREGRKPEQLNLYAAMLAKQATDILCAASLQLLSAGTATGPAGAAAALQLLTSKGVLQVCNDMHGWQQPNASFHAGAEEVDCTFAIWHSLCCAGQTGRSAA